MPNKPINGLSIEEVKKRVAAGIENRRRMGQLPPETCQKMVFRAAGRALNRQQRQAMIRLSDLAIYSLANNEPEDYCGAIASMNNIRRAAGFKTNLIVTMCKDIAEVAADLSGEKFEILDMLARSWLDEHFKPSSKVISIAKGKK